MKKIKILFEVVLLISIVLYGLFFTHLGLKVFLFGINQFQPNLIYIEDVQGSLSEELTLKKIAIKSETFEAAIEQISFKIDLLSLLNKKLHFIYLNANNVKILRTKENISSSQSNNDFSIANYLSLQKLDINNFSYTQNDKILEITHLIYNKTDKNDLFILSPDGEINGIVRLFTKPYLQWNISLDAKNIMFNHFIPTWTGKIHLLLNMQGALKDTHPVFQAQLSHLTGEIKKFPVKGNIDLDYRNGNFQLKKSYITFLDSKFVAEGTVANHWNISWNVHIPSLYRFDSNIEGKITSSGKISGKRDNPVIFANINAQNSNVKVNGTLLGSAVLRKDPHIIWNAQLKNGDLRLNNPIIHLQDINLHAENQGNLGGQLQGQFKMGNGLAKLNGTIDFNKVGFPALFYVNGTNLNVQIGKEYQILFTPKLKIIFADKKLNIEGNITIPNAKIMPRDMRQVKTLSNDIVILNQPKQNSSFNFSNLSLNVLLDFTDVNLVYNNLDVLLKGYIKVSQKYNALPLGTGTVSIVKGTYKMYGRSLHIDHGKLMYAGNALTNPTLDIKATQQFDKVGFSETTSKFNNNTLDSIYSGNGKLIVGVNVEGTASQPQVTFFSEPSGISQNDILSYLVFGAPRSQITSINSLVFLNDLANSAHGNTSASNLKKVTNQVKNNLHLTEFNVGSTEVYNPNTHSVNQTTTVNIGRNLGKKLSIHYKAGVFTPLSVLSIRYKINKRFTFQTETSSLESAADLLYEIELD